MIDPKLIIAPISSTSLCGEDLSFSREFDQIQDARRQDDATLDQGDWVVALKDAEWPLVVALCSRLLQEKSKDIRLAVWLAEALGKTEGYAGLAHGYRLLARLIDNFWTHIHPLPEDGDQEHRIGNVSWLVNRSVRLVREIPVTESARGRYGIGDYESARALQVAIDRDPENAEAIADDKVTMAKFESARRDTAPAFYAKLAQDVQDCATALEELESASNAKLGLEGPSFTAVRDALENVGILAHRFAGDAGVRGAPARVESPTVPLSASRGEAAALSEEAIKSRAQALRQLRLIADYFRQTEPHSPVAYLADKAAHWAEMPLHAWLRAVVKDDGALSRIEELLGVERPKEP